MRYVIDLGANYIDGGGLFKLIKRIQSGAIELSNKRKITRYWAGVSVEPMAQFHIANALVSREIVPNMLAEHLYLPAAVGAKDGFATLNVALNDPEGHNTLPEGTHAVLTGSKSTVPQISLRTLLCLIEDPEQVVIKCDIEGSEYDVIPDLIEAIKAAHWPVTDLFIEWHDRFFDDRNEYIEKAVRMEQELTELGVMVHEWD